MGLLLALGTVTEAPARSLMAPAEAATLAPLYEAELKEVVQGQPVQKGGALAWVDGQTLHVIVYVSNLARAWGQIDLYDGSPGQGGTSIVNLALAAPNTTARSGGVRSTVLLTDARAASLQAGQLYLDVLPVSGDPAERLSAPLQLRPDAERSGWETQLVQIWKGTPVVRGRVFAVLEAGQLQVIGHAHGLDAPWARVDLVNGRLGTPGARVDNLLLNTPVDPEAHVGFGVSIPLTEEQLQDLHAGLLRVEVEAMQAGVGVGGHLQAHPNTPPEASTLLTPEPGATVVVGGAQGEAPVGPQARLLTLTFAAAGDAEGDLVGYLWQLSRDPSFGAMGTTVVSFGTDSLQVRLGAATLAAVYDAVWGDAPIHSPQTVYHRALTTDGAAYTYGEASTLTLVRGTITPNEPVAEVPARFAIHGNYPNPFNPTTTLVVDLPLDAEVHIDVFDLLGRRVLVVETLVPAGRGRRISVDASTLPSGAYVYRLVARMAGEVSAERGHMTLLK